MSEQVNSKKKDILLQVGTNEVEFLEFGIAGQRLGVNVAKIVQVLVLKNLQLTRLPGSEGYFLGTISVRNKSIPTFDLRKILGIETNEENFQGALVLLMEFNRKVNAFIVDSVYDIERISWSEFHPIEEMNIISSSDQCVIGTVTVEGRIILILDIEGLLERFDKSVSVGRNEHLVKSESSTLDRSKLQILYCEDSPVIRKMALQIFKNAGYADIKVFPTGAKGLDYLNGEHGKDIDIVVTDIEMPELDGLSFCKKIKSNKELSRLPVIFFSSLVNESLKAKCDAVKGDACYSKPEIHLVTDKIEQLYLASKAK